MLKLVLPHSHSKFGACLPASPQETSDVSKKCLLLALPQSKRPLLVIPLGHAEQAAVIVFAEITITILGIANKYLQELYRSL